MPQRTVWQCTGGCILAVFLLWAVADSESFRNCIHDRKDQKPYEALHEEGGFVIESVALRVKMHLACGFVSANENNGAISALAAVAVAVFTGTLWWVTWGMVRIANRQRVEIGRSNRASMIAANAAKSSAETAKRALDSLERPYVFVSSVTSNFDDAIGEALRPPPVPRVEITIRNFGRTPAVIETLGADIRLSGDDDVLVVSDAGDLILALGESHTFECKYDGAYSTGVAGQIRGGQHSILLALSISYRDVFGIAHETRAEWKWWRFNQFHPESAGPRYRTAT